MKINFGLLGLAAAQSGDDRWEDNSYDYDISSDRWSNENQYSLDEANAGITFGVMARVTKQQDARHFQKALKLSCWNSNMIRDMNNDNKFSVYFNDQVEHKRFHPGISGSTDSPVGGTVDNGLGRDDLSWLYAVGDLRTGYNHQYGFEHNSSDPYGAEDANRLGVGTGVVAPANPRNNNRLRQNDEVFYNQSYQSTTDGATDTSRSAWINGKARISSENGIKASDPNHSVRPDQKWSHRKWGYQSDNVERAQSGGYDEGTVVYHFGHHDNTNNDANRPNMRFAANSETVDETSAAAGDRDNINMISHEFDFFGFKDDWRYSLRMGGCLYEAARWVYDESSFHRTGRLTYTDDTLFMDDPFNPLDGTDIFGAHASAGHSSMGITTSNPNIAYFTTTQSNAQAASAAALLNYQATTCNQTAHNNAAVGGGTIGGCATFVEAMGTAYDALINCTKLTANVAACSALKANCTACSTELTAFETARDAVYSAAASTSCFYDNEAGNSSSDKPLSEHCQLATTTSGVLTDLTTSPIGETASYLAAIEAEAIAEAALINYNATNPAANPAAEFTVAGNDAVFTDGETDWTNAANTNTGNTDYTHGNCNGTDCASQNVATPTSGGVFADVHWVHVFNAHIFPLQDVGYYQYDQTLGLGNINIENDSITSRDGYGYNIYTAPGAGQHHVMRDVWGTVGDANMIDSGNNAAPGAALDLGINGSQFHNQYGTINIGNIGNPTSYTAADRPNTATSDFHPILTKTRRKIEDFNVVMANPTYEGHGFLNFVATYHDHTENFNDTFDVSASGNWIRQVGKRFLSTIGGLTTASNAQRLVCRAVKDGIDSYRMNGLIPGNIGTNNGSATNPGYTGEHFDGTGLGHDDPFLAPLGPGPAGNYGNGQRCGAAMYENFGDWFLRPAQTYSAYNNFSVLSTVGNTTGDTWNEAACAADTESLCLGGMESYNYWAFILSEGYHPIRSAADTTADPGAANYTYLSAHELWRNGSLHYDRSGSDGNTSNVDVQGSSGRGFAISSFPHNELGKDFRFNIRTLHNMGNGVAKQYYQISNLTPFTGNEAGQAAVFGTLRTSNLRTSETVWSYYFYAVDTIKIAFPEFVARINHCDSHTHRNTSHCMSNLELDLNNGNPDTAGSTNGINTSSMYPGYADAHPHRRLGFQDIIIDGVTMKKSDNQYDSRATTATRTAAVTDGGATGAGNWHKQYHNARGLRGDDHTRATLHYLDTEFANEDLSLTDTYTTAMCGADHATLNMNTDIRFFGASAHTKDMAGQDDRFQGYTDSYQPLKPCASWCALDTFGTDVLHGFGVDGTKTVLDGATFGDSDADRLTEMVSGNFSKYGGICGRVLRIDGLLQTYDELHNRQYGTLQEIWVQLQYAYQESLDNSYRTTTQETCNKTAAGTGNSCEATATGIRKVQSPFPNVFFSAPEVIDVRGFCPSSNMKCRGYMSDQHQPYGGSRSHVERVHWNDSTTRFSDQVNAFGANQLHATGGQAAGQGAKQSGNDWTMDRDFRGDSKWPWNYHSYTASDTTGIAYGGTQTGTQYTGRDHDHTQYSASGTG